LLYRYTTSQDQRPVRKAKIYTKAEHGIILNRIDPDAIDIVKKLARSGFKAYIVGGAVRDLLLGKRPKDFDIATDARPRKIRRLFRRSRIVGRRFKLVHVYCAHDKIIEVSTFRSSAAQSHNNIYGTLGEDAFRRDFSLNALFYCPQKEQIIDYVDGITDIKKRRVRVLGPVKASFLEDPIRMIRAVKYASVLDFSLPFTTRYTITRWRDTVNSCSPERLTEELYKILQSGHAYPILHRAYRLKLLEVLLPSVTPLLRHYHKDLDSSPFFKRLVLVDKLYYGKSPELKRGEILAVIFVDLSSVHPDWEREPLSAIQHALRGQLRPLVPSNKDLLIVTRTIKQCLKQKIRIDGISFLQKRTEPQRKNDSEDRKGQKRTLPHRRRTSRKHNPSARLSDPRERIDSG
jgi:poly(A) polymerase